MQEPQVLEPEDGRPGPESTITDYSSTIDTSRPFRSVKEAVAVFGERILVGEVYNPKPFTFPEIETPFFSPSPSPMNSSIYSYETTMTTTPLSETVKKLEAELEDTKNELKVLKERESENEVALASLNAEIQKNMSKLQAEAEVAWASRDGNAKMIREEEKKRDAYLKGTTSNSKKLAQILSIGEDESLFVGRKKEKKVMKKKPIVPLVGNFFSWKKETSTTSSLHSPLHWNI
ncbi:hypothetical protein CASFOL_028287 [Castilleja foliolosa]|uniref:WEB family protein n=1 Tax=Castilleja foliolosa TaxID=1961234 RepID=A0ABD3C7U4_9LAMI